MADDKNEDGKKKTKLATALKRHKQDLIKHFRNRVVKSRIQTAKVSFEKATSEDEKKSAKNVLNSLIDKACKKGIYKKNKAARLKSRLAAK